MRSASTAQKREHQMAEKLPIHSLAANLESKRLKEIQALAAKGGTLSADALQKLAFLQAALVAVREEIVAHSVSIGGGSEKTLA
jgi:hypothetical protein